jgi:hypothetical protein
MRYEQEMMSVSGVVAQAFAGGGDPSGVICLPFLTGTGHIHEAAAVNCMQAFGLGRGDILYVCTNFVAGQQASPLGVETVCARDFRRRLQSNPAPKVIFLGEMHPEQHRLVAQVLEERGFSGLVVRMGDPDTAPSYAAEQSGAPAPGGGPRF